MSIFQFPHPPVRLSRPAINITRQWRHGRDSSAVGRASLRAILVAVILVLGSEGVDLLRVAEGVHDRGHLVVLLPHLLEPAVLLGLLGREARLVLGAGGAVDMHGAAAAAAVLLALQLDLVSRHIRDRLLRLAQRQAGDVVLVLGPAAGVVAALLALPAVDAAEASLATGGGVDVVVVAGVLGWVVVLRVGGLGLRDLHGAGALLLGEVQVRLVPLDARVGLLGGVGDGGGARALAPRADGPSGGGGAAVACVDLGVLDGDLFLADGVVFSGCDGVAV